MATLMEVDDTKKTPPLQTENGKRKRGDDSDVDDTKEPNPKKRAVAVEMDDIDRGLWLPDVINGLVKKGITDPIFRVMHLLEEDGSLDTERFIEKVIGEMGKEKQVEWKQKIETMVPDAKLIVIEYQELISEGNYHKYKTKKKHAFTSKRLAALALYDFLKRMNCFKRIVKTVQTDTYEYKVIEEDVIPQQPYSFSDCVRFVERNGMMKIDTNKGIRIVREIVNPSKI